MEDNYTNVISTNLGPLVAQTNLAVLLPKLIEVGVLTETLAETFQNHELDLDTRLANLYLYIEQTQSPETIEHLVQSLKETDHADLADLLKTTATPAIANEMERITNITMQINLNRSQQIKTTSISNNNVFVSHDLIQNTSNDSLVQNVSNEDLLPDTNNVLVVHNSYDDVVQHASHRIPINFADPIESISNNCRSEDIDANDTRGASSIEHQVHPFVLPTNVTYLPDQQLQQVSVDLNAGIDLRTTTCKIRVKPATRFYDLNDGKIPTYPMRSKKRGVYLIINNIHFVNEIKSVREGAEVDHSNLIELFKQMGFIGENHFDLSERAMKSVIQNFADSPILDRTDSFVMVVMSHGNMDMDNAYVWTTDGKNLYQSWILKQFNNAFCEKLQNIPKIFLFQCCRGDNPDAGVSSDTFPPTSSSESRVVTDAGPIGRVYPTTLATLSDMLICQSTVEGFASHRDKDCGTWFIQTVCEVWAEHACDMHVEEMMKLVSNRIQRMRTVNRKLQTPSYENRGFSRHCYFHPQLYLD